MKKAYQQVLNKKNIYISNSLQAASGRLLGDQKLLFETQSIGFINAEGILQSEPPQKNLKNSFKQTPSKLMLHFNKNVKLNDSRTEDSKILQNIIRHLAKNIVIDVTFI